MLLPPSIKIKNHRHLPVILSKREKYKKKKGSTSRLSSLNVIYKAKMKIIKNGQTYPVYSVITNRAFERIKLLVQSRETKSDRMHS